MKIDPKLVDQFRDAAWDAHPMPDDHDKRLQFIAQRAADHVLEEAAKVCEAQNETGAHIRCAAAIRKMKGEQ